MTIFPSILYNTISYCIGHIPSNESGREKSLLLELSWEFPSFLHWNIRWYNCTEFIFKADRLWDQLIYVKILIIVCWLQDIAKSLWVPGYDEICVSDTINCSQLICSTQICLLGASCSAWHPIDHTSPIFLLLCGCYLTLYLADFS